jgi:hypothetical protein
LPTAAQGGRFDHADRLFASVGGAWRNCLGGSSDVKELVPEFFYLPEFLLNADGHDLGARQVRAPFSPQTCPGPSVYLPWMRLSSQSSQSRKMERQ